MKLLKKSIGCGLAAAMLCSIPNVSAAASTQMEQSRLYFSCTVNDGVNPGFIPANECEEISSDTFFVSGNTIFVDDTVNHRIIVYEDGNYSKEIPLEWNMDVKQMYYDPQNDLLKMVYLDLNADDATHLFLTEAHTANGQLESALESEAEELSNAEKVLLEYCFDQDGNLLTQYLDENETADGISLVSEQQTYAFGGSDLSSRIFSVDKDTNQTAAIATSYVQQDNLSVARECILVQQVGEMVSFAVPKDHTNTLDRGCIQSADDGSIYQMNVDESGIQIFQLAERDIAELKEEYLLQRIIAEDDANGIEPMASYKSITKTRVKSRMDTYYKLPWTFNSNRNANKSVTGNPQQVQLPSWLSAYADGRDHSLTNVPYCWGGWNAETFVSNINAGKFAGNTCTTSSGYVSGTVGMDCSGYVSVAFDLPYKHGTSTLSNCFTKVSNANVAAYNIMNKASSHVMIVTKVYTTNGTKYVDTYEESSSAGKIVVRTGRDFLSLYNSGYVPMKYNYIQ